MDQIQIDWLTVFVAAFLNIFIGWIWYSKWLFGPTWESHQEKKQEKPSSKLMLITIVNSLVIAYFLAFFQGLLGVTTVSDAMFVGFCFWLGFVITTQISPVLWERQPLALFFLHTSYKLLSFLVMSGVIGA